MKQKLFNPILLLFMLLAQLNQASPAVYQKDYQVVYSKPDGQEVYLNAFYPVINGSNMNTKPVPAIIDIHGGWFIGGEPARDIPPFLAEKGIAVFSISYRLGANGGFPQNIRDCRNAVRFIKKHAAKYGIDTTRIGVMGGSAGGYLSLMVAQVPENFDDGGPTPELVGYTANVHSCFSYIAPTDMLRFWYQGPDDIQKDENGTLFYRPVNDAYPNDSRPRFRLLFHGLTPETAAGTALYKKLSPLHYIRKNICPILLCDGDIDPIVPGLHGKILYEKLKANGNDVSYWLTELGGHQFPAGQEFEEYLMHFLNRTLLQKETPRNK